MYIMYVYTRMGKFYYVSINMYHWDGYITETTLLDYVQN